MFYGTCGVRVGRDVEYFMYTARDHEELCAARLLCAGAFVVCGNTSSVFTGFYHSLMKRVKHTYAYVLCVSRCVRHCVRARDMQVFLLGVCAPALTYLNRTMCSW